jgi:hypothetical protein
MRNEADDVVITGLTMRRMSRSGRIQPSDENSTVKYSTGSDDKLTVDNTIGNRPRPRGFHRRCLPGFKLY